MFKLISAAAAALLMLTLVVGIAATVEDWNNHTHSGYGPLGEGSCPFDRLHHDHNKADGSPGGPHWHCPPPPPTSTPQPTPTPTPTTPSDDSSSGSSGASTTTSQPSSHPMIGQTGAATASETAGDLLVLQPHDQPGMEIEVGIGWISRDGETVIALGFVRDGDLGQTYAVVRRESDGQVVRLWIAPDSPLVYAVPWAEVLAQYTFPVGVILTIPLDEQYPWPGQLARRFDGGDDRILAYDAELAQWRHVPDLPTFQALGFYWCDVTAADAEFFTRITIGDPYPATTMPAQDDYPVCRT